MAYKPPKKLPLALLPTPIQKLSRLGSELGIKNLYVKRDDLTGLGMTGNKVRKLEYLFSEALRLKATGVITCGGSQSNHARATAVAAIRLGLKPYLVLRGRKFEISEGNLFLDKLMGADIQFITPQEYLKVDALMQRKAKQLQHKGEKIYIIPEGGSNEFGSPGYIEAMKEIRDQERKLGIAFDYYVAAAGSGGTLAGMILGKQIYRLPGQVIGFNVCDNADYFQRKIQNIIDRTRKYLRLSKGRGKTDEICIYDGYVGEGYSIPYDGNIQLIKEIARIEGIFLDPVYTSKAFYGMIQEVQKGTLDKKANILFLHSGGVFGLLAQRENFDFL